MSDLAKNWEELVHDLKTQDNRITGHPLYQVQQKTRVFGMSSDYSFSGKLWYDAQDCEASFDTPEEVLEYIAERGELVDVPAMDEVDWDEEEVEICGVALTRVFYLDRWEFVTAHLTEKAAQRYIDENGHNLTGPRIYVSSQNRCKQWIWLLEMITSGAVGFLQEKR